MRHARWLLLGLFVLGCEAEPRVSTQRFVCAADRECAEGYICRSEGESERYCVVGARSVCELDDDCEDLNQVCWLSGDLGRCRPVANGRCRNTKEHCQEGEVCAHGNCYGGCVDHEDCTDEEEQSLQCVLGQCVNIERCDGGRDCQPGFTCLNGLCRVDPLD